jgi:hypothetical protein
MAKLASAATKTKSKSFVDEVNPGVKATAAWNIYRSAPLTTLAVNADQLDVTENGTLIFLIGGSNGPPQLVVAGEHYLYCSKVR